MVITTTCSLGLAEWEMGDTIDSLLRRADTALYEAKRTGRNRIVASDTFTISEDHDKWKGQSRSSADRIKRYKGASTGEKFKCKVAPVGSEV